MSFIRRALNGKLSLTRRQHDNNNNNNNTNNPNNKTDHETPPPPFHPPFPPSHALADLPTLPHPRRPLTPPPTTPHPHHHQPTSPFFRLPPELRHHIYLLLLAHRELHLDMRYTAAETSTPHSTAGASLHSARRWHWRASACHRHPAAQPLADRCGWGGPPPTACHLFLPEVPCGIGREVLGMLGACRLMYREVVDVLYGGNVFHVGTGSVVLYTGWLLPAERAGAVRRLVYRVTEESVWDYADEHLAIEPGLEAYRVLLGRLPRAFPALVGLMVLVEGAMERGQVYWGRGERAPLDAEEVRECILEAMDGVVREFGAQLGECVLALGHAAFDRVMGEERDGAERVEVNQGKWVQFWRPVGAVRRREPLDMGYWVRRVSPEERGPGLDFNTLVV
ncbi:hypothetical protein F5144DRAFT_600734 [Chaetomium tenue]|uniref:Uncharacterized protein n=1 Tax=Chaetomium tenue TaxID=1854479 RepID=A0ACB7P9U4_9PEZI|nr:hypothetical protein F5144DRAFT_600734 [Chaetomium globosum]